MNESDIRSGVREIVASVLSLPAEHVPPGAHFYDDLGGDSLQKLEVIAYVESRFGCRLTNEQAAAGDTVDALVQGVALNVS
ncbi:acyl carrier protein [Streptomyces sp. NPDC048416]|uniref:acyl carrier protein n=1 Tax=Streptomyces sp. NPDC048416 TaxID=3365546 RepID=UPI00371D56C4